MYYSEYSIFISWQRIRIFIPDIPLAGCVWAAAWQEGGDVAEPYYVIIITDYYYSAHITILQVCWGQGTTPGHSGLAVVKTNI